MRYERIDVSCEESKKYASTWKQAGKDTIEVQIVYNDDGTINEKETYSNSYRQQIGWVDKEAEAKKAKEQEEKDARAAKKAAKKEAKKEAKKSKSGSSLPWPIRVIWWLIKLPFRIIWWILKLPFSIFS